MRVQYNVITLKGGRFWSVTSRTYRRQHGKNGAGFSKGDPRPALPATGAAIAHLKAPLGAVEFNSKNVRMYVLPSRNTKKHCSDNVKRKSYLIVPPSL